MSPKSESVGRSLRPRSTSPVRPVADTFTESKPEKGSGPRRTKTSLALDVELYRRAKIAAIQHEMTVSEYIEAAIREALDK